MFAWIKERLTRRAARKGGSKQHKAADLGETFRQAKDNDWPGLARDARRNHPGSSVGKF